VLAGGRAARLGGADKPGLVIGGHPLLDVVTGAAAAAGARELIIVGPRRPGPGPAETGTPIRWAREDPPGSGPVPALRCGLAAVGPGPGDGPLVLLLAADLPFLRPEVLTALAGAVRRGPAPGAVLEDGSGRPQWLISCWVYGSLAAGLGPYRGHSLHGLLGPLGPARLSWAPPAGEPPPWLDCDTPGAVDQARAWADR
jgi:molybdopterin-guanine dinucleotide biosynthesis protein A